MQDNRPRGPVSKDEFNARFEKHIAENVAKGSALCPLGSTFINDSNKEKLADDLDLNGFDPNAPDSDDEPLSDLEMWEGLQNIATLDVFSKLRDFFSFLLNDISMYRTLPYQTNKDHSQKKLPTLTKKNGAILVCLVGQKSL